MRVMNKIIKDLEDLRNNRAGEQHGYFSIGGNPTEDEFVIDTLDICKVLAPYEIDYEFEDKMPEPKENSYGFYEQDFAENYIDYLDEIGYIRYEDGEGYNSYNWNAPVSNNINYTIFKSLINDGIYVLFKVHRYGDVRGNYTNNCILYFDNDYEWFEVFDEVNRTKYVTVDGIEYAVEINFWRDTFDVYDKDWREHLFYVCGYDRDDIIAEIKEKLESEYNVFVK